MKTRALEIRHWIRETRYLLKIFDDVYYLVLGHILFQSAECYLASICQAVSGWVGAPSSAMRQSAKIQNTGPGSQSEEAALGSVVAQQLQR